jgi:hypothetical protein
MEIGYITPKNIRLAIFLSAKLRSIKELGFPLPMIHRIRLYLHFRQLRNKEEHANKIIQLLQEKLEMAELLYNQIQSKMEKASKNLTQLKIAPEDGHKLVEIANSFARGSIKSEIAHLLKNLNTMSVYIDNQGPYFTQILSETDNIVKTISEWDKIIDKYNM